MALKYNLKSGSCNSQTGCSKDSLGCPQGVCPDFVIRRHDTRPAFKVSFEDCEGAIDFRGLVIEANMWALCKLKNNLLEEEEYFRLADDIGFNQIMIGDVIVVDQVRLPEKMLVVGFDEHNKLIKVQRGYHGTTPSNIKRGTTLRVFRILNGQAQVEIVLDDVQNVDGTVEKDVIQSSSLIYEWQAEDTCLPGCYWMEFKVLKMIDMVWYLPGGNWTGDKFQNEEGVYHTGQLNTDSSVVLYFDQVTDKYLISNKVWNGEYHVHTDGNYYTGSVHDSGSVLLNKTGVAAPNNISYDESGLVSFHDVSMIPSFTDESLTPEDFGCILGEGVEWVRRFPIDGEGFLIKIVYSPTSEA